MVGGPCNMSIRNVEHHCHTGHALHYVTIIQLLVDKIKINVIQRQSLSEN